MKKEYVSPLLEVGKISVGGVLMDSPTPFPLPSAPGGGAPERKSGKEPAF